MNELEVTRYKTVDLGIVCDNKKYLPAYSNEYDACMDLRVKIDFPEDTEFRHAYADNHGLCLHCVDTKNSMWILPNEGRVFGTGIKVSVPENHVMLIYPRSSTGFKLNCMLANGTGIIDSQFRDELLVKLVNFGSKAVRVEDGQRVAQFMIIPRPKINLVLMEDNEDFRQNDRGGGIGHSGRF